MKNLQELSIEEQKNIDGGFPPLLIVGAIYAGSFIAGAGVTYGGYKLGKALGL